MNLLSYNLIWAFCKPLATAGLKLNALRKEFVTQRDWARNPDAHMLAELFWEKTVLNGPFKGLVYPGIESWGSTIYPKLLGSYERELHTVIEQLKGSTFDNIIDIGCAEGYYAKGLARLFPDTDIYAFDIAEEAGHMCREMARINNVADAVHTRMACGPDDLKELCNNRKSLILCDCEGYEFELFGHADLKALRDSTLIIEVHSHVRIDGTEYLSSLFSDTHKSEIVYSIDDYQKVKSYQYPQQLGKLSLSQKKFILQECRGYIMEWLILYPLN